MTKLSQVVIAGFQSFDRDVLMVDISIIIVFRNQLELLERCLQSISDGVLRNATYEVILVDNGSTHHTSRVIRQKYPAVRLLVNSHPMGHSVACNQGLAVAHGRYSVLLDSDTEVYPGALETLMEFLKANPAAGAVGPNLLNPDLTDQGAAKAFPTPMAALFGRKSLMTRLFPNNPFSRRYLIGLCGKWTDAFEVDSTSSACLMVTDRVLARVGGLDERFSFWWDDVDWCRRIKEAGWRIWVVPQAKVIHWEGRKRRTLRQRQWVIFHFHLNVYRYYCKHHAKSVFHPMRWVALIGLTLRAAVLMALSPFGELWFLRSR